MAVLSELPAQRHAWQRSKLLKALAALRLIEATSRLGRRPLRWLLKRLLVLATSAWLAMSWGAYLRIQRYQRRLASVEARVRGQQPRLLPGSPTLCPEGTLKENALRDEGVFEDPARQLSEVSAFNDDALVFAASGRAVLLQVAHPYIAQGVYDHSALTKDPHTGTALRFFRTFGIMFPIWFGDDARRHATTERWRTLHRRVKGVLTDSGGPFKLGDPYSAADLRALWWVQATLTESSVAYWSMMSPEKATEERLEAYWRLQGRRLFLVLGIPPEMVPESYREFEEEYVRLWSDLGVTAPARATVAGLQSAGRTKGPLCHYLLWSTFEKSLPWLPPGIAEQFGPFPLWRRIYGPAALSLDLGLVALVRSLLIAAGAGRLLEMSYLVEMRRRSGQKFSTPAAALYALGRRSALGILHLTLGGGPAGLREDWT